jgi:hypothetical protein
MYLSQIDHPLPVLPLMRTSLIYLVLLTAFSLPRNGQAQTMDTLVDVGGYRLHFNVIAGKGMPILFDAGGGNDGTVWNKILEPLAHITGAPLITYDRAGFGKSGLDTNRHGILNGIIGLETGLQKLGYDGDIMLVAHSLGGFYATLYAARNPEKVKVAVLIDANHICFYNDRRIAATQASNNAMMNKFKGVNPGVYYIYRDFTNTTEVMKTAPFPLSVPVIDLVSEMTPFGDTTDRKEWLLCHRQFADQAPNRTGIIAYGCGHYIFEDNPPLVVYAIVKAYTETIGKERLPEVLKRSNAYSVEAANQEKRTETAYRHTENDLNSWGYSLMAQGRIENALAVFKLNTELHPTSWNVFDSYGEALLKAGKKPEAILMYKKSFELNPNNTNARDHLEKLKN